MPNHRHGYNSVFSLSPCLHLALNQQPLTKENGRQALPPRLAAVRAQRWGACSLCAFISIHLSVSIIIHPYSITHSHIFRLEGMVLFILKNEVEKGLFIHFGLVGTVFKLGLSNASLARPCEQTASRLQL